jgi:branched-chain amino acid transport system permease protein
VHRIGDVVPESWRRRAGAFAPAALVLAVQLIFFPAPLGIVLNGATIGLLTAMLAIGMALVYRANRVINFAQADLGITPAVIGVALVLFSGINYFVGFATGLAAAVLLGALVELLIVRRFFRAPRLILTVATIGLAQLLAGGSILLAQVWDESLPGRTIDFPGLSFEIRVSPLVFEADYVVAWVVGVVAIAAVALFLRRTSIGTAVRAASDSADRAALLGVPVQRLHTVVWAVATVLSFLTIWLRTSLIGFPLGSAFGFLVLLRALAAVMLGRLTNLPAIAACAIALGILETGVQFNAQRIDTLPAVLGGVILVGLLLQRPSAERSSRQTASTWQAADEVRAVPPELRSVGEVRLVRAGLALVVGVVALWIPHVLNTEQSLKASALLVYAIIATSIVVLTGWAGQVSLGQMAFVAWGSAVTAKLTIEWNVDFLLALLAATIVGALVAVLVGLPALRLRGLFLAVITLAFGLATTAVFLNEERFGWVTDDRYERLPLLGRIDISSPTAMYYVVLAGFAVVMVALRGIRRSRTGRVLVALRENEAATQAFGVSATRAKLTGFAISGAVAAFAGALFSYHQQAFDPISYDPFDSISVFVVAVVGGLGTLLGGFLGALYLLGGRWFLPADWVPIASGIGVMFVLLVIPFGLGGLFFRLRDAWLRWVAGRRGIIVPSLLADRAAGAEPMPEPAAATAPVDPADAKPVLTGSGGAP